MEENLASVGAGKIRGQGKDEIVLNFPGEIAERSPLAEKLGKGGSRVFLDYLDWMGLSSDPDLILISPTHHYFYDYDDLKGVKTVVNLKLMNQIKEIRELLLTVNCMLSLKSCIVGSFIDKRHQYMKLPDIPGYTTDVDPVENGIISRNPILNMIYDFLDSRTNNRNMTKKSMTLLLEEAGFSVVDMTEINGFTCFCAQKVTSASGCE